MDEQNTFQKIGSIIPGYKGYAQREHRRNCDKLLRDQISNELSKVEKVLTGNINEAIKAGDMDKMRNIEDRRKDINTLNSKIKYAPYGATSFFSAKKIREEELVNIYLMDMDLADSVKDLSKTVVHLNAEDLVVYINSIESNLDLRNSYIQEFK